MSDTPRNDACKWTPITDLASLSQQLERELAEARRELVNQESECGRFSVIVRDLNAQLTAHKAALEKCEMCLEWFDTGRFTCGTEAHPGSVESNVPLKCHRDAVKEAISEIAKLKGNK